MLQNLFHKLRAVPHSSPTEDRRLAAAVLLLEVARADTEHHPAELAVLRTGLEREFKLPADALDRLLADAQRRAHASVSLFDFVQTLNRSMAPDEKRQLMKWLWDVAHADGRVDPHEEHLLRRLAGLLHLPHADFIRAKLTSSEKS